MKESTKFILIYISLALFTIIVCLLIVWRMDTKHYNAGMEYIQNKETFVEAYENFDKVSVWHFDDSRQHQNDIVNYMHGLMMLEEGNIEEAEKSFGKVSCDFYDSQKLYRWCVVQNGGY